MTSLRDKLSSAASRSPRSSGEFSSPPKDQEADKYRLLVTAGPSYDTATHKIVHVNTSTPTVVENEFLTAAIKVRIRGYRGLPSSSPSTSAYFDDPAHAKDQYSIAFSFIPKIDLPSVDTVWGNDFDHPVRDRLPPGFNTAFKIVKEFIDPGLECDAYADEPWLYGPSLSCWFGLGVGNRTEIGEKGAAKALLGKEKAEEGDILREGAEGEEGWSIRRELGIPDNNEKRRKHFLSRTNRETFTFGKGRVYRGDFYNPYLDFGNFALKLPGFSIRVIKYIDEKSHRLRYVFKNRKTGVVYFCVNLNLLWGDELRTALEDEQKQVEKHAGAEVNGVDASGHEDDAFSGEADVLRQREKQAGALNGDTLSYKPSTAPQNEANGDGAGSSEKNVEEDPGLTDRPPHLIEEVKKMSIQDMLLATASSNRTQQRTEFLDHDVD